MAPSCIKKYCFPKVWTDAYLAAFAIAGKFRLVTLDGDFETYEKSDRLKLILLKP